MIAQQEIDTIHTSLFSILKSLKKIQYTTKILDTTKILPTDYQTELKPFICAIQKDILNARHYVAEICHSLKDVSEQNNQIIRLLQEAFEDGDRLFLERLYSSSGFST